MESRFAKIAIEEELPCTKLHPSVDRVTSCTAIILSNRHRIKHSYFTVKALKYYKTSFKPGNSLGLTFNPMKNGKSMFSPSSTDISIRGHFVERPAPVTSFV